MPQLQTAALSTSLVTNLANALLANVVALYGEGDSNRFPVLTHMISMIVTLLGSAEPGLTAALLDLGADPSRVDTAYGFTVNC